LGTIDESISEFPALVVLDEPLRGSASRETRYFVIESRNSDPWEALQSGEQVRCSMTGISETQALSQTRPDTSAWRGEFPAARVDLSLA
jgi:hypothetical protein